MRFRGLDLNLLIVLDALLNERSVSRAALRLGLKQSAVSSALGRLREHFGDELLAWRGRQMTPTTLAYDLQAPLRSLLHRADAIVSANERFDPAACTRVFTVLCSDSIAQTFMPGVVQRVMAQAPRACLAVRPLSVNSLSRAGMGEELERRAAQLAIAPKEFTSPEHPSLELFREEFVCIARIDHPGILDRLTLEQYSRLPHILVSMDSTFSTTEGRRLERAGISRRVHAVVQSYLLVKDFVAHGDCIGTVPLRLARQWVQQGDIRIVPTPFAPVDIRETLQWNTVHAGDPGLHWLRQLMLDAVVDF